MDVTKCVQDLFPPAYAYSGCINIQAILVASQRYICPAVKVGPVCDWTKLQRGLLLITFNII